MNLPSLNIGPLQPKYPIIQGGMAVRVSTSPLVGAVARAGGIGVIGATGMEEDELKDEIRKSRELAAGGIIGANIMVASRKFGELVKVAVQEKVDILFIGAGFSREVFTWGREGGVQIVPIVSSAKAAILAEKCGAPAVVAEGVEAGGHLGTDRSIREILPEIISAVKIPVVAAGGIVDGRDMAELVDLGASGIQMATRFVLSTECAVDQAFKQAYLNAQPEDIILIDSPVGFPGRAIANIFTDEIKFGVEIEECNACLKKCTQSFCIVQALNNARNGIIDRGLVFSGQNVHQIKEILSVQEIFDRILAQYAMA